MLLREVGWTVHLIAAAYSNDAEQVSDEFWVAHGSRRGWVLLTRDWRIRYRGRELAARYGGQLYCLADGSLQVADVATRFIAAEPAIRRNAGRGLPGLWVVHDDGRVRRMRQ